MDTAKRQAIAACGTCGLPEDAHHYPPGADAEAIGVLFALGGPCPSYTASAASLRYQHHLALTAQLPAPAPGGKRRGRGPFCRRCAHWGHRAEDCAL